MSYSNFCISIPEVLIPSDKVNLKKWAVVACDQYTSDKKYWTDVEKSIGSSPSTLNLVLPEAFLESPDKTERIAKINQTMIQYLDDDVFTKLPAGFILTERSVGNRLRKGLIVAVDLDQYSIDPDSDAAIRATEHTLLERIPPRMEIRENAKLELPHVILLMDDAQRSIIEPLWTRRSSLKKLYDFELMQNGGKTCGYFIEDSKSVLEALMELPDRDGMRFLVGDGNHSLASAKAVWDDAKHSLSESECERSPLRYALVELINVYDEAMEFKPIHRILMSVNPSTCLQFITDSLNHAGIEARLVFSRRKLVPGVRSTHDSISFTSGQSSGRIEISNRNGLLAADMIQPVLDIFLRDNPSSSIDYIHGDEELLKQSQEYRCLGFLMPSMQKETFFDTVSQCGVLPRKCFSIGEANEKRFYLEARLIR